MLVLTRRPGTSIVLTLPKNSRFNNSEEDEEIIIHITKVRANQCRIGIEAPGDPNDVIIMRTELLERASDLLDKELKEYYLDDD